VLDAVDGTLKLSGLANAVNRFRIVNDGSWATALALTDPTHVPLSALTLADFSVAVLLDGNPPIRPLHPTCAVALRTADGWRTWNGVPPPLRSQLLQRPRAAHPEGGGGSDGGGKASALAPGAGLKHSRSSGMLLEFVEASDEPSSGDCSDGDAGGGAPLLEVTLPPGGTVRLYTSTNANLQQCFVGLDAFQAADRASAPPGAEELAAALLARLSNRAAGGAFDVLRSYGNLGALLRQCLGWRIGRAATSPSVTRHATSLLLEHAVQDFISAESNLAASASLSRTSLASVTSAASRASAVTTTSSNVQRPLLVDSCVWLEAQCAGFLALNENAANMVPAVLVMLGAGAIATDFGGAPLEGRRLAAGRADVLYSANELIHAQLLAIVADARRASSAAAACEAAAP
jgi:hypothetical protein